jgi:hypothetical protein
MVIFFFVELTLTRIDFLDMVENWLLPQLNKDFRDPPARGALPNYHNSVTRHLNENLPGLWLGHGSPKAWPVRLPDPMPVVFSCGVALKIKFMFLLCQTVFRNSRSGFIKLWNSLIQLPYAKHQMSSHII